MNGADKSREDKYKLDSVRVLWLTTSVCVCVCSHGTFQTETRRRRILHRNASIAPTHPHYGIQHEDGYDL